MFTHNQIKHACLDTNNATGFMSVHLKSAATVIND